MPYQVVRDFEKALSEYSGAPYVATVDNCTNAIFLCCKHLEVEEVEIPSKTYCSVPCSIIHAGGSVKFCDREWRGSYRLNPYPIIDSAMEFFRGMYEPGTFRCLSFSSTKPINVGKGGAILTDNEEAYEWFKTARYCGRHEKPFEDDSFSLGWNMYLTPEQAARGLLLLSRISDRNEIVTPSYTDLSKHEIYTNH